jgi:hypothetical protein
VAADHFRRTIPKNIAAPVIRAAAITATPTTAEITTVAKVLTTSQANDLTLRIKPLHCLSYALNCSHQGPRDLAVVSRLLPDRADGLHQASNDILGVFTRRGATGCATELKHLFTAWR